MNMFNVATALNAGNRPAESGKSGKNSGEVTDDFKKLFQGKEEGAGSAAEDTGVSGKDVTQKKDDIQKKDDVQKTPGQESEGQDQNVQTASLFAAYQIDQGLRSEVLQAEPETETVTGENLTGLVEEAEVIVGTQQQEADLQPVQAESQAVAQALPAEKAADEKVGITTMPEEAAQPADAPVVSRSVAKPSSSGQGDKAQTDDRSAEQTVQAPEQPVQTETVQETAPRETVRMPVPQPEALPEKLTDQLLTKMADGVKEFEIQIEPENLGKIAVKISYENGQANISIICSERKALDVLGQNVREICNVVERNFGGSTTIILDKPDNDYLNQTRDENGQGRQNQEQEQPKEGKQQQSEDDAEQFLQKLRLGLVG